MYKVYIKAGKKKQKLERKITMTAKYTLPSGNKISIYMWSDFLDNKDWRGQAEVQSLLPNGKYPKNSKEVKKPLHKDPERGLYIEWFDKGSGKVEKVYLNEYDHIPYKELVKKLDEGIEKNDRWIVMDDDILATFLKESDSVSIIATLPRVDFSFLGIGIISDKKEEVFCHLTEGNYEKSQWHYKVTLTPDVVPQELVPSRSYYFTDLCSLLKKGVFRLIDKKELEKAEAKAMKAEAEALANKPFARFVKGFVQSMC